MIGDGGHGRKQSGFLYLPKGGLGQGRSENHLLQVLKRASRLLTSCSTCASSSTAPDMHTTTTGSAPACRLALAHYAIELACLLPFILKSLKAPDPHGTGASRYQKHSFCQYGRGLQRSQYVLSGYALMQQSPMRVTLSNVQPANEALLGTLFPGAPLRKRQLAALVLIAFGLWVVTRLRRLHQR